MGIAFRGRLLSVASVVLLVSASSFPYSMAQDTVTAEQADLARNCTPSIGIVSPEFVVINSKPQTSFLTIVAACMHSEDAIFLVTGDITVRVDLSPQPTTLRGSQILHGAATLPSDGVYTLCVAPSGAKGCDHALAWGPTVLAIPRSACSGKAIPSSSAGTLSRLLSESPRPASTPPLAPEPCKRHPARADKAVIVDSITGLTCTADSPDKPDGECSGGKKEKKPLQLRSGDTVRLYIVNKNPFLENYTFSSTDSQIKDDDIGTFLGLLVPGISGGGQTSPGTNNKAQDAVAKANATTNSANNLQQDFAVRRSPIDALNAASKANEDQDAAQKALSEHVPSTMQTAHAELDKARSTGEKVNDKILEIQKNPKPTNKDVDDIFSLLNQRMEYLRSVNQAVNDATSTANDLNDCVTGITERIDNLTTNYAFFAQEYNRERNFLLSGSPRCEALSGAAINLWELIAYEQAKILDTRMDLNLRDAAALVNNALASIPPPDPAKKEAPSAAQNVLTADAKALSGAMCTLKAMRTQIAPVLSANAASIEGVLINPNAFRSEILVGPYSDATLVDWTLQTTMTQAPIKAVDSAMFNAALDDCLSQDNPSAPNPQKPKGTPQTDTSHTTQMENFGLTTGKLIATSFSFDADVSQKNGNGQQPGTQQQKGNPTTGQPDQSGGQQPPQPQDSSTTTRGRRINFGSERFIMSAGLTGSPLGLQQFGKGIGQALDSNGKPVAGQETANIITYTTNQSYRLSPMAFLNTRAYQWSGKAEAVYLTLGITAKSDSNGVSPEYLVGLSQSFIQRHLMLTVGAYVGRQQKLTGGLHINQAIPSNLTGDIPTQSNYAFNVGFSLSWRIPGLAK